MAIRSDADCRPVIIQNLVQYTPSRNESISTQTPIAAHLPPHRGISSRVRGNSAATCRPCGKGEYLFRHGANVSEQDGRAWAAEMLKRQWQAVAMQDYGMQVEKLFMLNSVYRTL